MLVGTAWRKGEKMLLDVLPPCPFLGTCKTHSLGQKALAACKSPKEFCFLLLVKEWGVLAQKR